MYFSTLLENLESTRQAKRQGLAVSKYETTISEIIIDYNQMIKVYNNVLPNMTHAESEAFANEIDSFFLILNKLNCSKNSLSIDEKRELQKILESTKIIRDYVSIITKSKSSYKNNEAGKI